MKKGEILAELQNLSIEDRREIFDRLCEMEERDVLNGAATPADMALLDRELAEYHHNPDTGSGWNEVKSRIRRLPLS